MQRDSVVEVILATNPNLEGNATAMYVAALLRPAGIKVTRLASGLPVGGDLEYADEVTLGQALEGRREMWRPSMAIVTDSAGNLPPDTATHLGITVVPMYLNFGHETYRDGVDLAPADFYERLATGGEVATTSTPSPADFLDAYRRTGRDRVVCVTVAGTMSASSSRPGRPRRGSTEPSWWWTRDRPPWPRVSWPWRRRLPANVPFARTISTRFNESLDCGNPAPVGGRVARPNHQQPGRFA